MLFRQQHKKRRYSNRTPRLLISGLAVVISFAVLYGVSTPSGFAASFAEKTWHARNRLLSAAVFIPSTWFSDKKELVKENNDLKERLADMGTISYRVRVLERENRSLRDLLNMGGENSLTAASIISKPPFTPSDILMIDSGTEEGLSGGRLVIDGSGIALGEVGFVNNSYSKVVLFSISGKTSEATLESGEQITIHGRGGGSFFFEAPKGFGAKKGDLIFIREYPLAQVTEVIRKKNDPFIEVYLESLRNIQSINKVGVVSQ